MAGIEKLRGSIVAIVTPFDERGLVDVLAEPDVRAALERGRVLVEGLALHLGHLYQESELEQRVRIREQFLSIASHELKTPLTSIYGILQLQERMLKAAQWPVELRMDQERHLSFLRLVLRQTERMTELIDGDVDGKVSGITFKDEDMLPLDIVIFSAGGATSKALAPKVAAAGAVVEGLRTIDRPEPLDDPAWAYGALGAGLVVAGVVLRLTTRRADAVRGRSTWAHFVHHARWPELPVALVEGVGEASAILQRRFLAPGDGVGADDGSHGILSGVRGRRKGAGA